MLIPDNNINCSKKKEIATIVICDILFLTKEHNIVDLFNCMQFLKQYHWSATRLLSLWSVHQKGYLTLLKAAIM